MRPRSVLGLVRCRAPLALLLFVASLDGLVVQQDGGGFALLQRPRVVGRPPSTGGYALRLLRRIDRHWDTLVFAAPPLLGIMIAVVAAMAHLYLPALLAVLAGMLWITAFLTGMAVFQLWWMLGMGSLSWPGRDRESDSLTAIRWSVPLLHQPAADRVDDLLSRTHQRLEQLIRAGIQEFVGDQARADLAEITESLVVVTHGVTTKAAEDTVKRSVRTADQSADGTALLLHAPSRRLTSPRRHRVNGSFAVLYLGALALVVAVLAWIVANVEAAECLPAACVGHPATYFDALRFLLNRLYLQDTPGLAPGTVLATSLGWLVSAAALTGVAVVGVAGYHESTRNRDSRDRQEKVLEKMTETLVLILVVTEKERDAVRAAVHARNGRTWALRRHGIYTVYDLGPVEDTRVLMVQAAEQGTGSASGMLMTARETTRLCHPDHVLLVGICYGLRPDEGQRLGDVVVSRRVQNMDHRKIVDREGKPQTIYRGVNVGPSPVLMNSCQSGQATWADPKVRVHFGTVLSSNTVFNSQETIGQLRQDFPDAIAGEMEAAGVYEACTVGKKPNWIMIKAISDLGYRKSDRHQQRAAENAARFAVHMLATAGLQRGGEEA
ncbi:hypothetical protein AB0M43_35445 [Longispora sp. NPDC051575]|uniref:5'-methylthioadenosine/S-adenosylhomocysteine nucleosidase family protein n=1 Tax=Longispora sp. NPDC051575 TaxID=3154943 RepID=UPI0034373690